ncbi:two-component regulator propeller domain-containing protein [Luteolibacter algae]|uniref:Two-component regulator propeller domain-containing protein n=1 Tax=Luteolibacter algae TaxID=454151 RepID=A0ABW5D6P7_9BACT
MPLRSKAFHLIILLFAVSPMNARPVEEIDMLFRNWTTRDGLPNNRVRSVIQSHDGFIWLATDAGAVRFNGANFKLYGLREGLLAPIALTLLETEDQSIWVGTLGGGITVLKNGRIERTFTTSDGLPSNWISDLTTDSSGNLIAWTRNGAAIFEKNSFTSLVPANSRPLPPRLILKDRDGSTWHLHSNRVLSEPTDSLPIENALAPDKHVVGTLDHEGRIWACGENFLWTRSDGNWKSIPLPEHWESTASSIAAAPDGTIWIASHRRGILGYRNNRFITPTATRVYSPALVETVTTTKDGQVWITSANGIFRMSPQTIRVSSIDDPLTANSANNIGGLIEYAPHSFIVATQGSGYYRWENHHATPLEEKAETDVGSYGNALLKTRDGSIWLGSNNGLFKLDSNGGIAASFLESKSVWALFESTGAIWVGTSWGKLYRIAGREPELIDFGGAMEPVKAILEEPDGTLWIGTRGNGIFRRKNGIWKRFGRNDGLISEVIRTLYLDSSGRIWAGSDGGGLSLFSDGRFITATSNEGLPSDTVSQIIADDNGRLWIGTHKGLGVLDIDDLARIEGGNPSGLHPLILSQTDGLPTDEFTIVPPIKTSDGSFAFATIQGFIRISPDFQKPVTDAPPVYLERVVSNGTEHLPASDTISLEAGSKRIEIEFSALYFSDPDRLQFRNRLLGLEKDWQYVGSQQSAEYRNLAPNSYLFEVSASNGNGEWSRIPATIEVVILPHFWQTLWFKIIVFSASIAFVARIVRQREKRRNREKIGALQIRHAIDIERARIARDLHDDVGASLTQMALQSQLVERNITRQPDRASNYLQEIFKTARTMTRSLDEIVWAVNPGNDVLDNFVSFLATFVQDFAEGAALRTRFDLPENIPKRPISSSVRHHLYLATKEILHNIVKHADASEISMGVSIDKGSCQITISDNGRGFTGEINAPGEDGLSNLKKRFQELRGTCVRHSEEGNGTSFVMKFPIDTLR